MQPLFSDESNDELSQVACCADSGNVCVLTWDGRLYARACVVGTTSPTSTGHDAWLAVCTPRAVPVLNVAFGRRTIWVVTVDGTVRMLKKTLNFV